MKKLFCMLCCAMLALRLHLAAAGGAEPLCIWKE